MTAPAVEAPETNSTTKPATKPATVKPCGCGDEACTSTTARSFAPGHDAKMVGRLTRAVLAGEMTEDEAKQAATNAGGSALLISKLNTAIPRERTKAEAKVRRAAEKASAKTAPEADADAVAVDAEADSEDV